MPAHFTHPRARRRFGLVERPRLRGANVLAYLDNAEAVAPSSTHIVEEISRVARALPRVELTLALEPEAPTDLHNLSPVSLVRFHAGPRSTKDRIDVEKRAADVEMKVEPAIHDLM